MYAHLLAGKSIRIGDDLICHQRFEDKSILEEAINQAQFAGLEAVATVRDVKRVRRETFFSEKTVVLLEARERVVDSALYGLMEGILPLTEFSPYRGNWERRRALKEYVQENPEVCELAVLYCSSDVPCLRSQDFKTAIEEYQRMGAPDILIMATPASKVLEADQALHLDLGELKTTLGNNIITDRGAIRISNMYVLKPFQLITSGIVGSLQKVYDHRYLSQGITAWLGMMSGLGKVLVSGFRHNLLNTFKAYQQGALARSHIQGRNHEQVLSLQELEERTSRLLGLQIKVSTAGSLAQVLDVDDEATLKMYQKRYGDIVKYLGR